jgi:UrcA family protein
MKNLSRIVALGALLSTPLALIVPAHSADTRSEVVKYNDLNITSPAGAKALYTRLKVATWRVCRDTVDTSGTSGLLERSNCMTQLLDTAVKDVNKPLVTALHTGAPTDLTASR